jgi:hypothetical protein
MDDNGDVDVDDEGVGVWGGTRMGNAGVLGRRNCFCFITFRTNRVSFFFLSQTLRVGNLFTLFNLFFCTKLLLFRTFDRVEPFGTLLV